MLVQAGASGSGSMAIQVAKALGANVITTVSTDAKAALARSIGADEVVRYREADVSCDGARLGRAGRHRRGHRSGRRGDDGGQSRMPEAARHGGELRAERRGEATIPHLYPFFRNERRIVGAWMGSMAELKFGLDLVKQGRIRAALHKTLPLKQAREAHRMMARAEVVGKLALLPWAA